MSAKFSDLDFPLIPGLDAGPGAMPEWADEGERKAIREAMARVSRRSKQGPKAGRVNLGIAVHRPGDKEWKAPGLARAERVMIFCEQLMLSSGKWAGSFVRLLPWQRDLIEAIYAVDAEGIRQCRTALLSCGRKNGKTELVSALSLAHLVGPESQPHGELVCVAADRSQAAILWEGARKFLEADPYWTHRCIIRRPHFHIEDALTGSTLVALAGEEESHARYGSRPSFVAFDELAQCRSRALFDAMSTAQGLAGTEPLMVITSTISNKPEHVFSELIGYAGQVSAGVISDSSFVSRIYMAPAGSRLDDEEAWAAANPSLGSVRSREELRIAAMQAKAIPGREPAFRSLYLNQPVDLGAAPFLSREAWFACGGEVEPAMLTGPCYGGLDLSNNLALTALVLYWPATGAVVCRFWLPREGLAERVERDHVAYDAWAGQGLLTLTEGRVVDRKAVFAEIVALRERFNVLSIAADRWRLDELTRIAHEIGIELELKPHGQGYRDMGPSLDATERAVIERRLRHGLHPILTSHVSECTITRDPAGNRKPDRKSQAAGKYIDGAVALVMAIGESARSPVPSVINPLWGKAWGGARTATH